MSKTQREKDRAEKKCEIAIDKMVALQDSGFGCDTVTRVLDLLNSLQSQIRRAPITPKIPKRVGDAWADS